MTVIYLIRLNPQYLAVKYTANFSHVDFLQIVVDILRDFDADF